jgi:NAD(P)-dependent dehydrogenase (short-subunit alcohol dehydrogenase family)
VGVLDGKVAIVTGAGRLRGIGRATAAVLAAQGADVKGAGLIAYRCSPIAESITGQSINIDGGVVMW